MSHEKFDLLQDCLSNYLIRDIIKICYSYCEIKEYPAGKLLLPQDMNSKGYSDIAIYQNEMFLSSSYGISVFSLKGEFLRAWKTDPDQKENSFPSGIAIFDDEIYTNTSSSEIRVFDLNGKLRRKWVVSSNFHNPVFLYRLAVGKSESGDQEIYVTDAQNDQILVFDHTGKLLRKWDQFDTPLGICISNNEVYVVDHYHRMIQVFTLQGELLQKWPLENLDLNRLPIGISREASSGIVYLTTYYQVWSYTSEGKFLRHWEPKQRTNNDSIRYNGIFCYCDKIYVTNSYEYTIYVFERRF